MKNNPLPNHINANVNMITIEEHLDVKGSVVPIEKVKMDTSLIFDASVLTTQEQASIYVTATTTYMPLYNTETPNI